MSENLILIRNLLLKNLKEPEDRLFLTANAVSREFESVLCCMLVGDCYKDIQALKVHVDEILEKVEVEIGFRNDSILVIIPIST